MDQFLLFFTAALPLALIGVCTGVSTFLGGALALRIKDKLHLVLGFSAGAVIGVVFFDLLPEAISLGSSFANHYRLSTHTVFLCVAVGFVSYLILDRSFAKHTHGIAHARQSAHHHRGDLGAGSLALHSFLDGAIIGVAFQSSRATGLIVTLAVLAHDFSDGMNTVNLVLKSGADTRRAFKWPIVDALAPLLGILSTLFIALPSGLLAPLLALISGSFLYIGASELIPESHHAHPTRATTLITLCGMLAIFIATRLVT